MSRAALPMVHFHNASELPIESMTIFGLSAKQTDDPIGRFGTGLKYAIAIAARLGAPLSIRSGSTTYTYEVSEGNFRGRAIRKLALRSAGAGAEQTIPLPFTTDLGLHWEPWMAYRELHCNALDESGGIVASDPGTGTCVSVGPPISSIRHDDYFLSGEPDWQFGNVSIYQRATGHLFLKGVRITKEPQPWAFTYNFREMTLSEDRFIDGDWQPASKISRAWTTCTHLDALQAFLLRTTPRCAEWKNPYMVSSYEPSEDVLRVFGERLSSGGSIPPFIAAAIAKAKPELAFPTATAITRLQQRTLDRALAFLQRHGHEIASPTVYRGSEGDPWGRCIEERIFISTTALDMGTKHVAATLLEEHLHAKYHYNDCSREMQEHLLKALISTYEQIEGDPL